MLINVFPTVNIFSLSVLNNNARGKIIELASLGLPRALPLVQCSLNYIINSSTRLPILPSLHSRRSRMHTHVHTCTTSLSCIELASYAL